MVSLYQELYNIIIELVYGGQADAYGEWVATLFSTGATIFALALPLIIVWKIICTIANI